MVPPAPPVEQALDPQRERPGEQDREEVDGELGRRPDERVPVPERGRDADVRGGGDGRDRDQDADQRARLRRREAQHAGRPRAGGDDEGERIRARDDLGQAVRAAVEVLRDQTGGVERERGEHREGDREREADRERERRAGRQLAPALHERDAQARDRTELGADDHRPDDQDRGVEEDADRGDDRRQHHVDQEDAGQLDALARALIELLPDDGVRRRAGRVLDGGVGEVRDRVGRAQRDRPVVVDAERAQVGDDHARVLARDVAHHEVPGGPHRGVRNADHVDRGGGPAEHRVDPIGAVRRRHDPQMNHPRSLFGVPCKNGCSTSGRIWRHTAKSGFGASEFPVVATFSVRRRP